MNRDSMNFLMGKVANSQFDSIKFIFKGWETSVVDLEYFKEIVCLQKSHLKEKKYNNIVYMNGDSINLKNISFIKENSSKVNLFVISTSKNIEARLDALLSNESLLTKNEGKFDLTLTYNDFIINKTKKIYLLLKSLNNLENVYLLFSSNLYQSILSKPNLSDILNEFFDIWIEDLECNFDIRILSLLVMKLLGLPGGFCQFGDSCTSNHHKIAIMNNGIVFLCENVNNVNSIIGNIRTDEINDLLFNNLSRGRLEQFRKRRNNSCLFCEWHSCCNGGCISDFDKSDKRDYFCSSYKKIFQHFQLVLKELSIVDEEGILAINENSFNKALIKQITSALLIL